MDTSGMLSLSYPFQHWMKRAGRKIYLGRHLSTIGSPFQDIKYCTSCNRYTRVHVFDVDTPPCCPRQVCDSIPICRLQRDLRQGLSLAKELLHFAAQAKSMSAALKHRSLASLIAALPARKEQLFQQRPDRQGPTAAFLPDVEAATWHLL